MTWSLPRLLEKLHEDIERRLATAREAFAHSGTKGDASEYVWLELLTAYLPERYRVDRAHVVDSKGIFSQQIDVVIFDRQYSPPVFNFGGQTIIPAESVYAVFETKQTINAHQTAYAQDKLASVRRLHRTSLPVPHAGGIYEPKEVPHIIGGILTFDSDWTPPLGEPLVNALSKETNEGRIDMGCVAAHGTFGWDGESHTFTAQGKPATAFLLELIARLQASGTVPMIDTRAYSAWLDN